MAAITYPEQQETREIVPAGYSLGAWVTAGAMLRRNLLPAVLVSPPVKLFPFDFELLRGKVGLMICGGRDRYCPPGEARVAAAQASCPFEILPGTDHFFHGSEANLAVCINVFLVWLRSKKKFTV